MTDQTTSPKRPSKTGFGFDAIMADPDHTRFRGWYDQYSYFAPGRDEVEAMPGLPDAEAGDGRGLDRAA